MWDNIMKKYPCIFIICLVSIVAQCYPLYSQIIQEPVILTPFQNPYPAPGRTIGGVSLALPDSVVTIYDNPASLAQIRSRRFFLSSISHQANLRVKESNDRGIKPHKWSDPFDPGTATFSYPFSILKKSFTVGVSYNGSLPEEYEIQEDYFGATAGYSGDLRSVFAGLGMKLSSSLRIGFGWTRWFGKRTVTQEYTTNDASEELVSKYHGNLFHLGVQKKYSRKIDWGAVVYLPFQLSQENTRLYYHPHYHKEEHPSEQTQKFSAGLKIGLAYSLLRTLKFGLSYEFYSGFTNILKLDSYVAETSYSRSFAIAGGFEYVFKKNDIIIPIYLVYKATKLPKSNNFVVFDMGKEMVKVRNPKAHIIEFGGNVRLRYVTVYLAAQWRRTGDFWKSPPPIT